MNIYSVSECDTGYYPNSSFDCIPCPLGKYKPSVGANICTNCPQGMTTSATGQSSSDACGKLREVIVDISPFLFLT